MKKILLLMTVFMFITSICFAKKPCKGKDIDWLRKHIPIPVSTIESKKSVNGMCEIILKAGTQFIPVYAGKDFVLAGEMFQEKIRKTEATLNSIKTKIAKNSTEELNKAVAFTYTPENSTGKSIYMITDPLCPYCSKAAIGIKKIADETKTNIKVILYTVHGEDGIKKCEKAICNNYSFEKYINTDWKSEKVEEINCDSADELMKTAATVAQKIGITGVPAFVFEDGKQIAGGNLDKIRAKLSKSVKIAAK